jgi:hypothetical protein
MFNIFMPADRILEVRCPIFMLDLNNDTDLTVKTPMCTLGTLAGALVPSILHMVSVRMVPARKILTIPLVLTETPTGSGSNWQDTSLVKACIAR